MILTVTINAKTISSNVSNFSPLSNVLIVFDILRLIADIAATYGYPDSRQAEVYCSSFRISVAATIGIISMMHIILVLSGITYRDNQHRSSAIFEPLDVSSIVEENNSNSIIRLRPSESSAVSKLAFDKEVF